RAGGSQGGPGWTPPPRRSRRRRPRPCAGGSRPALPAATVRDSGRPWPRAAPPPATRSLAGCDTGRGGAARPLRAGALRALKRQGAAAGDSVCLPVCPRLGQQTRPSTIVQPLKLGSSWQVQLALVEISGTLAFL
ncbi:hypothetical protein Nmel_002912, partial [Mimus melanotis]